MRSNYKWVKPLKFLGLEFDGEKLRAATRGGANLVYDKAALVEALSARMTEMASVSGLHAGYVVHGVFPGGTYMSPLFASLSEARRHRNAMGGAYLRIRHLDPSGMVLCEDVPDDDGPFSVSSST